MTFHRQNNLPKFRKVKTFEGIIIAIKSKNQKNGVIMNSGESLLSIGAMMLLAVMILRVNNTILTTNSVLLETKFGVLATSLATSIIEEATGKAFDQNTYNNSISQLSDLTSPGGLGPGNGETYDTFNDVDDFNEYTKVDSSLPSAVFYLKTKVCYVQPTNPDQPVNTRTWHKRISVTVSTPSSQDTFRLSSVVSYWFFR